MSNLPILGLREFTSAGAPLAGGKLYFYEAGSSTAKNTYSDEACTAPHVNANPVVADANGRFGEIYLLTDGAYKAVLKTSADVTLQTWDNINATTLNSSNTAARIRQIASNPIDYGAVGDGVADESGEVQDAIDAATGVVDLLGKTFKCDSAITLRAGITLRNGTLNFAGCSADEYIIARGTRGSAILLTGNATAADEHLHLASVAGLAVGDWLFLYASDSWGAGSDAVGEMVRIESIAGLDVTLAEPIFDGYTTANGAAVKKLSLVPRVVLQDLTVTCAVGATGSGNAIMLDLCEAPTVRNVTINTAKGSAVSVRASAGGTVSASNSYGSAGTGVGFDVGAHSRNVNVVGCAAYLNATGFRIGQVDANDGVTRMCAVRESAALGCTTGLAVARNSQYALLQAMVTMPSGGALYTDLGAQTAIMGIADLLTGNYDGMVGVGGGTGSGVSGTGGASNGDGVTGTASGTGIGLHGVGGSGGGRGVYGEGGAAGGFGVEGQGGTNGDGVVGFGDGTGAGFYGTGGASGWGVNVTGGGGGVYGGTTASGKVGVHGYSANGIGVVADGDTSSPAHAPFSITPQDAAPTGPNYVGEMYVASLTGKLYICTAAGTPGTWTLVGSQT